MTTNSQTDMLDRYYRDVRTMILDRQDWVTGLLPASTAVTSHGNYTDAWVRDNVYSILAAWGLALAYRKAGDDSERCYILEQSVVKLMRGLLIAMLRQAPKVEKFKHTQDPLDALHAKYNTRTGGEVVADNEWGHLQIDATSLFLLMLAQMTAAGLKIVFSIDEVNFVQNLVHYISRAYRTPDYGIWERGNKMNHGIAELNASSIGMAKAALEAMAGCNLFGRNGGQTAVVHVISDDIARCRIALEALLPRESLSKEVDSAVFSVTGFPAFAVDDPALRLKTETRIVDKLQGRYGCKRFLLDGHQTELEDPRRLHYEPQELKQFMDIECEWPLFFCYLLLNRLFAGDGDAAQDYRRRLEDLLVERDGQWLLPELYRVPKAAIAAEKQHPHSQPRVANDNVPLVWAQSLYILGGLLQDGLIGLDDIDPLQRHSIERRGDCTVLIALLAEDDAVKRDLHAHGVPAQTLRDIQPIQVRDAGELAAAYTQVGRNDRIGLSGRPLRQLRPLATSRLYELAGEPQIFLPQFMNQKGFYIAMDNRLLMQRLRMELGYISRHWDSPAPPLLVINVKHNMLGSGDRQVLLDFIAESTQGNVQGVKVRLGPISEFVNIASREKIGYLHDFRFSADGWEDSERPYADALPAAAGDPRPVDAYQLTAWEAHCDDDGLLAVLKTDGNPWAQMEILGLLARRRGLEHETGLYTGSGHNCRVRDLLEEVYARAGDSHAWRIVRRCAGMLGKYDINLEQAATEILVRQHALTLGHAYSGKATLRRPADSSEILQTIRNFNGSDTNLHIIIQELVIYLGMLIKLKPELFADMHTVRVGHVLQLIIARQKRQTGSPMDLGFNEILASPPWQLARLVQEVLEDYGSSKNQLGDLESLHYEGPQRQLASARFPDTLNPKDRGEAADWYEWREQQGNVGRENEAFYNGVWSLLEHCQGLIIGDKINSQRRIDSETTLAQMTRGEQSFRVHVNHLLNKIEAPVYRQLTVEAVRALALIFQENPLHIDDALYTDVLIGHAVRLCWLQAHPEHAGCYGEQVEHAWQTFYQLPPHAVANGILDALMHLLDNYRKSIQEKP